MRGSYNTDSSAAEFQQFRNILAADVVSHRAGLPVRVMQ